MRLLVCCKVAFYNTCVYIACASCVLAFLLLVCLCLYVGFEVMVCACAFDCRGVAFNISRACILHVCCVFVCVVFFCVLVCLVLE